MSIFDRIKRRGARRQGRALADDYTPAVLPSYGQELETFVTGEYSANQQEFLIASYKHAEAALDDVAATCDEHSTGSECDHYVESEISRVRAQHRCEVAEHEAQGQRILNARETRRKALEKDIGLLEKREGELTAAIEPLKDLRAQFQLRLGRRTLSLGALVTVAAMAVDAVVNYSFLQGILLSNAVLLAITVVCLSIMSDGSMWALGTFLSRRKENFLAKPMFWSICALLLAAFLLSVVTSVMIRYGSMDATYGTVNSAGEFVGKESYSLAEYGVTMATAFLTTVTGILSFAFSLDENSPAVARRERMRDELVLLRRVLAERKAELSQLESAPDPMERDRKKRAAAEESIEYLRTGLKLHLRKQMTLRRKDAGFTERMADSGVRLMAGIPEELRQAGQGEAAFPARLPQAG